LSSPISLHRPNGQRFHLVRLPPYPRNAQRKRKNHSISIVGRARQRVRSSHLIGSASAHHHSALAKIPALGPSHSRSRLATRQELSRRGTVSASQWLITGWKGCSQHLSSSLIRERHFPERRLFEPNPPAPPLTRTLM